MQVFERKCLRWHPPSTWITTHRFVEALVIRDKNVYHARIVTLPSFQCKLLRAIDNRNIAVSHAKFRSKHTRQLWYFFVFRTDVRRIFFSGTALPIIYGSVSPAKQWNFVESLHRTFRVNLGEGFFVEIPFTAGEIWSETRFNTKRNFFIEFPRVIIDDRNLRFHARNVEISSKTRATL